MARDTVGKSVQRRFEISGSAGIAKTNRWRDAGGERASIGNRNHREESKGILTQESWRNRASNMSGLTNSQIHSLRTPSQWYE